MKLLIVADYNDADYSKDVVTVDEEVFEKFLPMMKAINNFVPYVARHWCGGIVDHNWESPREDLGEKNLYDTYPQFPREYIDEFKDIFLSGLSVPYDDCGFHTIVKIQNLITDELYVDYDVWEMEKRYTDKVKGYLAEEEEIYSYKRAKDGKPLISIPYNEMTPEESELINRLDNLWRKYQ